LLPELGETVTVITKTGKQHEREFLGFDYGTILTGVERMGKTSTVKSNLGLIKNIVDSRGNVIAIETIRNLISEGKIPLSSSRIVVKNKIGTTQIVWEDIYQIQVEKKGMPLGARLALIAAGVGIIYIAIDAAIKEINKRMEKTCWASAVYDSPVHPHVIILQDFRDTYLLPSKLGRKLVNLYYKYSPFVANLIAGHKPIKVAVRINLLPLVAFSYSMLHFGSVIIAAMLAFISVVPIFLILFSRRKFKQKRA